MHQAGILTPQPAQSTFVALDSLARNQATLAAGLKALSLRARQLAAGGPVPTLVYDAPPADPGILGPTNAPDGLTITIAFGASRFDHRYGLASQRPRELIPMPVFATDDIDSDQTHGDVLVQICAGHRDTVVHTVRELLRTVRGPPGALDDRRLPEHWTRPHSPQQATQPVRLPGRHCQSTHHRPEHDETAHLGRGRGQGAAQAAGGS